MGEIRWEQDSYYMCAVAKGWKIDFYCKMIGKNQNKHMCGITMANRRIPKAVTIH